MDIDADQVLDDFVVQFPADFLPLLFLRGDDLAGQLTQLALHEARLEEELAVSDSSLPDGNRVLLEAEVGASERSGVAAQHPVALLQVLIVAAHGALGCLEGDEGLGEKEAGSF